MTSTIERQVMGSVAAIHAGRGLTSMTALKFYILVLAVWGIGRLVWVAHVVQNFYTVEHKGLRSLAYYVAYALEHTHLAVQVTLFIAAVAAVSLLLDVSRSLTPARLAA